MSITHRFTLTKYFIIVINDTCVMMLPLFRTPCLTLTLICFHVNMLSCSVPPKSLTLKRPTPVRTGNLIELACTAEDSNPKTEILWYRDNQQIRDAGK